MGDTWPTLRRYAAAVLISAVLTALMAIVGPALPNADVALFYLLAVLVIATTSGPGPGILASLLSFLAFNFFFVPPLYTFHVASSQDVLRLVVFLVVAVIASSLAAHARTQAEAAQRRAAEAAALYELSQAISAQVELDEILPVIATTTCRLLHVPSCAILIYGPEGRLQERAVVGRPDPRLRAINAFMRDGTTVLGVLRVTERAPGRGLSGHDQQLLDTLAAQARLAIERARLVEQVAHTQALAESDRLKSALISSVSHDLRTPLAAIKGAVSTLLADDVVWDAATQRALAQTIDAEADRLNRIVGNLLSMSRIEGGALPLERDWQDLAEVLGPVVQRMARQLDGHPLTIELPPDLPLVAINATLLDQVFTNLIENAVKYTPCGTPITITARCDGTGAGACVVVAVRDRGPGIPAGELVRIFDKFYRVGAPESAASGAGLGLAICKGIIEAHGGRIWAENCPDGGAVLTFTLPRV